MPAPVRTSRLTPEVDVLLTAYVEPVASAAHALRALLLETDPRIAEAVKWKSPSYHIGEHFATFNVRPGRPLVLVLHRGAKVRHDVTERLPVPDPDGLLDWRDLDRANVAFADAADVAARAAALREIVRAWIAFV
jgi:hypothetical protein